MRRSPPSSIAAYAAAGLAARGHRHRRRDPHRRGAAARECAGDRRPAGRAARRFRHRHRRPSHGGDARGLRLGRGAGVARRGQAHPQHRHRRRHHQARRGRERQRDRDRGAAYRRPAAGGRRRSAGSCGSIRPGKFHAREAGFYWPRGDVLSPAQLDRVAESMADVLVAALDDARPLPHAVEHLYLTDPIAELGRIDGIMFSGGVGEYVYGREQRDFGDMGRRLGQAIRRAHRRRRAALAAAAGGRMHPRHRARRVGIQRAALRQYQLHLQARRAVAAAQSAGAAAALCLRARPSSRPRWRSAIRAHFTAFDLVEGEGEVALALRWRGAPSYARIAAFAEGIRRGLAATIARKTAALHHARRRHRADAGRDPARGARRSRARSWRSTASCCAISTTSISAASACRPTPCR